jgi:hypothetical protein
MFSPLVLKLRARITIRLYRSLEFIKKFLTVNVITISSIFEDPNDYIPKVSNLSINLKFKLVYVPC